MMAGVILTALQALRAVFAAGVALLLGVLVASLIRWRNK